MGDYPRMESSSSTLIDYVSVLRKHWFVIAFLTVASIGVSLALSVRQTPIYASSAEVLVLPVQNPGTPTSTPFVAMTNELRIAQAEQVSQLAGRIDPRATGSISVTSPEDTETLVFSSESSDPAVARITADAYANAYLQFRENNLLSTVREAETSIDQVITDLRSDVVDLQTRLANADTAEDRASLQFLISGKLSEISDQQIRLTELQLSTGSRVGEVLHAAIKPSSPVRPDPREAAILGAIVGLILGVGVAFVIERFRPTLRTRDDLEMAIGAPVLAVAPRSRRLVSDPSFRAHMDRQLSEVFRTLRTVVMFTASQRHLRSLLVTSATEGEGKTTVATNLAIALAQSGKRVALVLADIRKASDGDHFGVRGKPGLAHALNDGTPVRDLVIATDIPNLSVLPPGSIDGAGTAEFTTDAIRGVLETISPDVDFVIADVPPVLAVSDALESALAVDAVLLVCEVERVRRDDVAAAAEQLRSVGADVIGVVATKVAAGRLAGFRQGYGYGYRSGAVYGGPRPEPTIPSSPDRFADDGTERPMTDIPSSSSPPA
jgi:capsular exopolysaccharide synthesis family protein